MHLSTRPDFPLLLLRVQYKNNQLNRERHKRIYNRLLFCQRQLLLLIQIILPLIQHTYYKLTYSMMSILLSCGSSLSSKAIRNHKETKNDGVIHKRVLGPQYFIKKSSVNRTTRRKRLASIRLKEIMP